MGKVSTSLTHISTSINNRAYHLMFCIKQIYFCYLLHFVKKSGCSILMYLLWAGRVYYNIFCITKKIAIKMNSRLAVYSKTISELLWQGLQVITVQLCKIFLFVRRRKIKNGIKMFSSSGLDPAGPRWFDGLLWDSWSELRKNTIRYLLGCLFVLLVLWLAVFSVVLGSLFLV